MKEYTKPELMITSFDNTDMITAASTPVATAKDLIKVSYKDNTGFSVVEF